MKTISIVLLVLAAICFTSCAAPREYTYCWNSKYKQYEHCKGDNKPSEMKERGVRSE